VLSWLFLSQAIFPFHSFCFHNFNPPPLEKSWLRPANNNRSEFCRGQKFRLTLERKTGAWISSLAPSPGRWCSCCPLEGVTQNWKTIVLDVFVIGNLCNCHREACGVLCVEVAQLDAWNDKRVDHVVMRLLILNLLPNLLVSVSRCE